MWHNSHAQSILWSSSPFSSISCMIIIISNMMLFACHLFLSAHSGATPLRRAWLKVLHCIFGHSPLLVLHQRENFTHPLGSRLLTYTLLSKPVDSYTPHETLQMAFISEFAINISHVQGTDSLVADARRCCYLSKIER